MTSHHVNTPATLRWTRKDVKHERRLSSVREAARIAMKEMTRAEFFTAHIETVDDTYAGDQIAEIFLTGKLPVVRYAGF